MKAFFKHFSFILIYLVLCQFTPALIIYKYHNHPAYGSYAFALTGIICFIIAWLMYRKDLKPYISAFFSKWYYIPMLIVLWVGSIIVSGIVNILTGMQEPENQIQVQNITKNLSIPILFITLAIIYPFLEEIIFRHILIGKLGHIIPISLAGIISCALFAGMHAGNNLLALAAYLPLSIALTIAYFLTKGRVIGSYTLHIIQNTLAAIVIIFQTVN